MCKQVSPDPSGHQKVCDCVYSLRGHILEAFYSRTSAAQRQAATTWLIGYLFMQSGSEDTGPSGLTGPCGASAQPAKMSRLSAWLSDWLSHLTWHLSRLLFSFPRHCSLAAQTEDQVEFIHQADKVIWLYIKLSMMFECFLNWNNLKFSSYSIYIYIGDFFLYLSRRTVSIMSIYINWGLFFLSPEQQTSICNAKQEKSAFQLSI